MKEGKMKRLRTLTKRKMLGLGWNLEGRKIFGEKEWFGSREKRERDWDIWVWEKSGQTSDIYIYIYIYRKTAQ